jgi:hypothetical protein
MLQSNAASLGKLLSAFDSANSPSSGADSVDALADALVRNSAAVLFVCMCRLRLVLLLRACVDVDGVCMCVYEVIVRGCMSVCVYVVDGALLSCIHQEEDVRQSQAQASEVGMWCPCACACAFVQLCSARLRRALCVCAGT